MDIIFTLCSNNYLAQAKTLGDSVLEKNNSCKFIIGLIDEESLDIDYSFFSNFSILPVSEIGLNEFDNLWRKYNIIELNTSVKATYFKYIFNNYEDVKNIFYVDPDIELFDSFLHLESLLIHFDILITPHILSPIQFDSLLPSENLFLNFGLYNLGFIGVNRNTLIKNGFLDWWENRTLNLGFDDTKNGYFVDQLWINFVPLFFDNVKIIKDLGYNVAPWNLHERKIVIENNRFVLSDGSKLYFYHFSSFTYVQPNKMSRYYDRYDFESFPIIKLLYDSYLNKLMENKVDLFSQIKCAYIEKRESVESKKEIVNNKNNFFLQFKNWISLKVS